MTRTSATSGRTRRGQVTVAGRSILRGELDTFGLPTLLTLLEMERRCGVLLLQRKRQTGRLWLRQGQVVRAQLENGPRHSGVEAVYALLTWPDGQFELWQVDVDGEDEIHERTAFLLMEGLRRMDEALGLDRADDGAAERRPAM